MATGDRGTIAATAAVQEDYFEKKGPTAHATPVTPPEDDLEKARSDHEHWQPGFFAQFPWLGLGALGAVLFCLAASVIVLVVSNGKTQTRTEYSRPWPKAVAPNVLISIFNSVANICFGIAISNGVAIAWWRRALKGGTIKDLNQSWQFSSSVKEIVLSGKAFNIIALTALVAKMTLIDSTLLQKSIGLETKIDSIGLKHNVTWGYINETFPFTGTNLPGEDSEISEWWGLDLSIWRISGGVYPSYFDTYTKENGTTKNRITGKTKDSDIIKVGTMFLNLTGAGFAFECEEQTSVAIQTSDLGYYEQNPVTGTMMYQSNSTNSTRQLYGVDFAVHHSDASVSDAPDAWKNNTDHIVMTILISNATSQDVGNDTFTCPGYRYRQVCRLRPATIQYPVQLTQTLDKISSTVSLATENMTNFYTFNETGVQQNYHLVTEYQNITDEVDNQTILGGIAAGLNAYLGGSAWLSSRTDGDGFVVNSTGTAVYNSANNNTGTTGCDFAYYNPLLGGEDLTGEGNGPSPPKGTSGAHTRNPGMVADINSIMLALDIDVSNSDWANTWEPRRDGYDARLYLNTIHYRSNFWYMGGAIASTIICILCVLPSYWGFWQLGRKVTLGPFEIAAAFRAPNLDHPNAANAPVEKLIEEVGDRRVQYGKIVSGSDAGRIGVAEPEIVERVKPKISVAGEEIRGRLAQTFTRKHASETRDA